MRAISLHQPWATAIALGIKRIETRKWRTHYRGPLVIHTAQLESKYQKVFWRDVVMTTPCFRELFESAGYHRFSDLPFGAYVAQTQLIDCIKSEDFTFPPELPRPDLRADAASRSSWDRYWGNYASGRYGWVLGSIVPLSPISAKGKQGFWIPSLPSLAET
jgi:hypothetical protein